MKTSRPSKEKSKWYSVDNRTGRLSVRISGLNLQGSSKTTGFFFTKELKQTVFMLQLTMFTFSWNCSRTFDEFRDFNAMLKRDDNLGPNRNMLNSPFPAGAEGDCDVMVLIERREMIEEFIQEVVNKIDFEMYEPLSVFINAKDNMKRLLTNVSIIKKAIRKFIAKKKLNLRLFKFYSKEIIKFMYVMESGIPVYDATCSQLLYRTQNEDRDSFSGLSINDTVVSSSPRSTGSPIAYVLWLDVCEEMALSRLCLATREIFELPPADYEDERLANGIFLSDIAEVRRGTASYGFRSSKTAWIKPSACVSVVGSERTLDIQFVNEQNFLRLDFIDMLNLLTIQSLHNNSGESELKLRNKVFKKVNCSQFLKSFKPKLSARDILNGNKMTELLIAGIEVDVEMFSPYYGSTIKQKLLKYKPVERKLYITSKVESDANGVEIDDEEEEEEEECSDSESSSTLSYSTTGTAPVAQDSIVPPGQANAHGHSHHTMDLTTQNRCIDIDDISEVRPGKISFCADGGEDGLVLSIVASETIICLPVSSIKLRNNLIRRFQTFVQMHRDYENLDSDVPRVFRRKSTFNSSPLKIAKYPSTFVVGGDSSNKAGRGQSSLVSPNSTSDMKQQRNKKRSPTSRKNATSTTSVSHHHLNKKEQIYSHLLQVRSVSMVRSSTMSSRNSASISEFCGLDSD